MKRVGTICNEIEVKLYNFNFVEDREMKQYAFMVMIVLMIVSANANLLVNGSFELPNPQLNGPISESGHWVEFGTYQYQKVQSANWAASEGLRGAWLQGWNSYVNAGFYQDVPAVAGQEYTLISDFKVNRNYTLPKQLLMSLIWLDGEAKAISSEFLDVLAAQPNDYLWHTQSLTAMAPAGSAAVRVQINWHTEAPDPGKQRSAMVDDMKLVSEPTTRYVDIDAPGNNNGSSWLNAFNHLQDAIAVASFGDSIWVAEGVYKPDQGVYQIPGNRTASFQLKNNVQIKGGFAGYGTSDPNENDPELYPVVLSGDLSGDDGPDFTNNDDNCYHVVKSRDVNSSALLEGVTVTAGNANGYDFEDAVSCWKFDDGEGITAKDSVDTNHGIIHGAQWTTELDGALSFDGNNDYVEVLDASSLDAPEGITIGMWINPAPGMNCDGNNNWRYLLRKGNYGWGAYNIIYEASWRIPLIGFRVNGAGGLHELWTSSAAYSNSFVFLAFTYDAYTGAQKTYFNGYLDSQQATPGGFILHKSGPLKIGGGNNTDCPNGAGFFKGLISQTVIYDRSLSAKEIEELYFSEEYKYGGGMHNSTSSPTVTNCVFIHNSADDWGGGMLNLNYSSPTVTNCTFIGNETGWGGGICNYYHSESIVTNCTFSANVAHYGGGIENYQSSPIIKNCILWDNYATSGNEIFNLNSSYPVVSYSDIKGGWPGVGNINFNPFFVNANANDYHLSVDSPCINSGDPEYICLPEETDLDGNPRVIGPVIDMGAYEYNHVPVAEAGTDQKLFAGIEWLVEVKLDGTGSYDLDGDELDYFWYNEANDLIATGAEPNVILPTGEHIVTLIVNDGLADSEPNDVVITVIEPLEVSMKLTPRSLNCRSQGNWVKAHLTLPEQYAIEHIDPDRPAVLHTYGIESAPVEVFINEQEYVEITAPFAREQVCSLMNNWPEMFRVYGFFTDGSIFYGQSQIRINPAGLKEVSELSSYWLAGCSPPKWCEGMDMNRDTMVNMQDYPLLLSSEVEFIRRSVSIGTEYRKECGPAGLVWPISTISRVTQNGT